VGDYREFCISRDILVPVEEGAAVRSVPHASRLKAAAVLEEQRAALEIAKEQDGALAEVLLVPVRLAYRVAIERHAEEFARDESFR